MLERVTGISVAHYASGGGADFPSEKRVDEVIGKAHANAIGSREQAQSFAVEVVAYDSGVA